MIQNELPASVADDDHESDLGDGDAKSGETADDGESDLGNADSGEIGKE